MEIWEPSFWKKHGKLAQKNTSQMPHWKNVSQKPKCNSASILVMRLEGLCYFIMVYYKIWVNNFRKKMEIGELFFWKKHGKLAHYEY